MDELRRVVTGQAPGGRACITTDGPVPTVFGRRGGPILYEIWKTFATPAPLGALAAEPAAGPFILEPPANGAVFRLAVIPPDADMAQAADHPVLDALGDSAAGGNHAAQMHRTNSIDFAVIIEGSIVLVLETGETELHAGAVVVQRGANHAWSNRTDQACKIAFVMINACPA